MGIGDIGRTGRARVGAEVGVVLERLGELLAVRSGSKDEAERAAAMDELLGYRTASGAGAAPRKVDSYVDCDGRPLWMREVEAPDAGHDGLLVFVHGNTFPAVPDFDLPATGGSLVERFAARGLSSVLFDHRGYGRSYRPRSGPLGVPERTRDLEVVLDHLATARSPRHLSVVALSTGALVTARLLAAGRRDIDSVVLLGPTYLVGDQLGGMIRKLDLARLLNALRGDPGSPYVTFRKSSLVGRLCTGDDDAISRQAVEQFLDACFHVMEGSPSTMTAPVIGFLEPGRSYARGAKLFDAAAFEVPVLVVRGEHDTFCDAECALALTAELCCPRVESHVVPGVKHDFGLYPEGKESAIAAMFDFVVDTWRERDGHGR